MAMDEVREERSMVIDIPPKICSIEPMQENKIASSAAAN